MSVYRTASSKNIGHVLLPCAVTNSIPGAVWIPSLHPGKEVSHHKADARLEELIGVQDPFIMRLE